MRMRRHQWQQAEPGNQQQQVGAASRPEQPAAKEWTWRLCSSKKLKRWPRHQSLHSSSSSSRLSQSPAGGVAHGGCWGEVRCVCLHLVQAAARMRRGGPVAAWEQPLLQAAAVTGLAAHPRQASATVRTRRRWCCSLQVTVSEMFAGSGASAAAWVEHRQEMWQTLSLLKVAVQYVTVADTCCLPRTSDSGCTLRGSGSWEWLE